MSHTVSTTPRSTTRRALLGGLTLGAAAVVAESVKPSVAQATQGQAILAGTENSETSETFLQNTNLFGNVLELVAGSSGGIALIAHSTGPEPTISSSNTASGNGMTGETNSDVASGVYGQNNAGGYGVAGRANNGVGVLATSTNGRALAVDGKAHFSRSGKKQVPAGAKKVVVSVDGLSTASTVLATLQKHVSGCSVEAAVPTTGAFTLFLSKAAPSGGLPVAWFILD